MPGLKAALVILKMCPTPVPSWTLQTLVLFFFEIGQFLDLYIIFFIVNNMNFPHFDEVDMDLKNTMLNKSGYFRTLASMIESTALDFWRNPEKPRIESYTINHDFRKIQVENTASCWILPYIYMIHYISSKISQYHVIDYSVISCNALHAYKISYFSLILSNHEMYFKNIWCSYLFIVI